MRVFHVYINVIKPYESKSMSWHLYFRYQFFLAAVSLLIIVNVNQIKTYEKVYNTSYERIESTKKMNLYQRQRKPYFIILFFLFFFQANTYNRKIYTRVNSITVSNSSCNFTIAMHLLTLHNSFFTGFFFFWIARSTAYQFSDSFRCDC